MLQHLDGHWFAKGRRPLSVQQLADLHARVRTGQRLEESWAATVTRLWLEAYRAQPTDRVVVYDAARRPVASFLAPDPAGLLAAAYDAPQHLGTALGRTWWVTVVEATETAGPRSSWTGCYRHEVWTAPQELAAEQVRAQLQGARATPVAA